MRVSVVSLPALYPRTRCSTRSLGPAGRRRLRRSASTTNMSVVGVEGPLALVGGDELNPGNEPIDRVLAKAAAGGDAFVLATAAARQGAARAVQNAQRWFRSLGLAVEELPGDEGGTRPRSGGRGPSAGGDALLPRGRRSGSRPQDPPRFPVVGRDRRRLEGWCGARWPVRRWQW